MRMFGGVAAQQREGVCGTGGLFICPVPREAVLGSPVVVVVVAPVAVAVVPAAATRIYTVVFVLR